MKIVSIVGARPQFVKLAVLARALAHRPGVTHTIIHTGQHYDDAMSGSFFRDLGIPEPHHNLEVGSGAHGQQTGEMMKRLEPVLIGEKPEWVLLYGDTNSTAAGAMTASKLHWKTAHIEAGLRSFNRLMPEEINRIVADHLCDLLFCPTAAGMLNLEREGLLNRSVLSGDVMYDAVLANLEQAQAGASSNGSRPASSYALATVHRAENTDDPQRLRSILSALERIAGEVCPIVLALHPRTRKILDEAGWKPSQITTIAPLAYREMLVAEGRARFILTDSGGVQKEAYFLKVPCVTLREETEWLETLGNGCNILAGAADPDRIVQAANATNHAGPWQAHYGDGHAGDLIADRLLA